MKLIIIDPIGYGFDGGGPTPSLQPRRWQASRTGRAAARDRRRDRAQVKGRAQRRRAARRGSAAALSVLTY